MFGSNIFGGNQQNPYEEIMKQVQLNQYNQMNVINPHQNKELQDIQKIMNDLSKDEQLMLSNDKDFMVVKSNYEQAFMAFISEKFSSEFSNTPNGQQANKYMLENLNTSVTNIRSKVNEERQKLQELSNLLAQNPNLINELKAKQNGE